MSLKIYSYPENKRVSKAKIAGQYAGVQIEEPAFQFGVDNKKPEFLAKNPLGKVPVLETPEGCIFESNAIARYVARRNPGTLFGSSPFEHAQVDQWIDFSIGEIELPKAAWLFPIWKLVPNNPVATDRAKADLKKTLDVLDKHLADRTFLVGERVSLADIIVSMTLHDLFTTVFDAAFRKPFGNVNRWFLTCVNQPQFKAVIGETVLCETAAVAPATSAAPAAAAAPAEDGKKEKKEKEGKGKEKKEKEAPKEKEPKADAADDGDDDGEVKEAKPKSALDLLPPAKMVLDEWKRTYSNNDARTVSVPWLWTNFDKDGYCMYWADFKYNEENTVMFKTLNSIGGWIQRLDNLRKYGFGSVCIFGDAAPFEVRSFWIFRGPEIPAEMKTCDDSELYSWRRVNLEDAKEKALVEDFLCWDGNFDGIAKKFNQGKIFK